jgi:hypothetical protein
MQKLKRGNCYIVCEALYHLLGGKKAGWKPCHLKHEGDTHWYLKHSSGLMIDPTVSQFKKSPNYSQGRGCGFLTKRPSKKAIKLMEILVWQ